MAPSGEACLVSDADGQVWLSSIYAPISPVVSSDVDQIIAEGDLVRVNRHFSSWPELVDYRDRHALDPPPRFPDLTDYSADEVRDALEETQTAHTPDERAAARSLLVDILRHSPVVLEGQDLYHAVLDRLDELTGAVTLSAPPSDEVAEAMSRYQLAAA
jgi:hypothetical protein